MQIVVRGKHIEVTDGLRSHAEEKVSKLSRYLDRIGSVEVTLSHQKNWQTAEVQVFGALFEVRSQERSLDMYESIDLAVKKLENQARRLQGKMKSHPYHSRATPDAVAERAAAELIEEQRRQNGEEDGAAEEEPPRIVKTKRLSLKPISPEEAADQMELVGHDFYVFLNADTDQVSVLYHRNDGNYGLIQPSS